MISTLHIQHLLKQHDCVILPSIGAFIAHSTGAEINILDRTILPPHKKVSFNSSIQKSDGLFAHYIANKSNVKFDEATILLQQQCTIWHTKMLVGEVITFENVGSLWLNVEKKIQFKPTAAFLQSHNFYGLPMLPIQPIERQEEKQDLIKKYVQQEDKGLHPDGYLNDFIKEEKQKPFGKQLLKWAVAAMLIGAIFSCGWWMFSNENDLSNNLSSFISFDSIFKSVSTFKNKTVIAEKKTAVKNNSAEEEKHPYTFYLTNPSEGYYLITYEGLDFEGANHQKLKYWRDGIDARIIQTDSTYQIGLYYFTTIDAIQEIKKSTDSMMHSDCKLLKALN